MTPQLTTIVEHLLRNDLRLLGSLGAGYFVVVACCLLLADTGTQHRVKLMQAGAATAMIVVGQIVIGLLQIFILPRTFAICFVAMCAVMVTFIFAIRITIAKSTMEAIEVFLVTLVHMILVGIILIVPISVHLMVSFVTGKGG